MKVEGRGTSCKGAAEASLTAVHLPARLPRAGHRPCQYRPLPSRQRRQAGLGLAGASSCSAPGGAPGSGSGVRGPGRLPHGEERRPGCEARTVPIPRCASASRLQAAGVPRASQLSTLPAARAVEPPAPPFGKELDSKSWSL